MPKQYTFELMVKENGKSVIKPFTFTAEDDLVALHFNESEDSTYSKKEARQKFVNSELLAFKPFTEGISVPKEKYTIYRFNRPSEGVAVGHMVASESSSYEAITGRLQGQSVVMANPIFRINGEGSKDIAFATDRIIIGFKDSELETQQKFLEAQNFLKYEKLYNADDCNVWVAKIKEDVFQTSQDLVANHSELLSYVQPDFITMRNVRELEPEAVPVESLPEPIVSSSAPHAIQDPLSAKQYALKITHTLEAWDKILPNKQGNKNIKIAILDEGVDTSHEDLKDALVKENGTFDAIFRTPNQEPNSWDGHGTACAGLAVGSKNAVGIRGIGAGCSLMAARIAYSKEKGSSWTTSNSQIASAIIWAYKNGADVLSNSWGGGLPSQAITDAFHDAATKGRNGKGCVIAIAAGNEAGPVSFPGNLPGMLTVSATNEYDEFKTKTSRDGEKWWGSNYGAEVKIGAPGVHNITTDITGTAGYDPGNYYAKFNGTSSATPIVSGAAGLILSVQPELKGEQVQWLLILTADKVGKESYTNSPGSKARNEQLGYGRLNVDRAITFLNQHKNNFVNIFGDFDTLAKNVDSMFYPAPVSASRMKVTFDDKDTSPTVTQIDVRGPFRSPILSNFSATGSTHFKSPPAEKEPLLEDVKDAENHNREDAIKRTFSSDDDKCCCSSCQIL